SPEQRRRGRVCRNPPATFVFFSKLSEPSPAWGVYLVCWPTTAVRGTEAGKGTSRDVGPSHELERAHRFAAPHRRPGEQPVRPPAYLVTPPHPGRASRGQVSQKAPGPLSFGEGAERMKQHALVGVPDERKGYPIPATGAVSKTAEALSLEGSTPSPSAGKTAR